MKQVSYSVDLIKDPGALRSMLMDISRSLPEITIPMSDKKIMLLITVKASLFDQIATNLPGEIWRISARVHVESDSLRLEPRTLSSEELKNRSLSLGKAKRIKLYIRVVEVLERIIGKAPLLNGRSLLILQWKKDGKHHDYRGHYIAWPPKPTEST